MSQPTPIGCDMASTVKFMPQVYAQTLRLGTTNASLKLKGIDGPTYQLWII